MVGSRRSRWGRSRQLVRSRRSQQGWSRKGKGSGSGSGWAWLRPSRNLRSCRGACTARALRFCAFPPLGSSCNIRHEFIGKVARDSLPTVYFPTLLYIT